MYLCNLKNVQDFESLIGVQGRELRQKLRLARLTADGGLVYLRPERVRRGWLNPQVSIVVDCTDVGRPYGATDSLYPLPDEVVILVRRRG
jgi:hypothetical protein